MNELEKDRDRFYRAVSKASKFSGAEFASQYSKLVRRAKRLNTKHNELVQSIGEWPAINTESLHMIALTK